MKKEKKIRVAHHHWQKIFDKQIREVRKEIICSQKKKFFSNINNDDKLELDLNLIFSSSTSSSSYI